MTDIELSVSLCVCVLTTCVTDMTLWYLYPCVCAHCMCDWYDSTVSVSLCVCSHYMCDWYDNTVSVSSLCVCSLHVTDMTIQYLYPCVCADYICDWCDNTMSVSLCVCSLYVWLIPYSICIALVYMLTTCVTGMTIQCLYPCVCAHYMCDWYSVCILVCVLTTCVAGMTIQCILVCVPTTCVTDALSSSYRDVREMKDTREGGRPRRDSDRSDGSRGTGRERRLSSSSSKTGQLISHNDQLQQ